MSDFKQRLYARAIGSRGDGRPRALGVSWGELLTYLWRRGARARIRGLCHQWRFGRCAGGLLIGRRVRLEFPRRIVAGRGFSIGDDSYVSAYAAQGLRIGHHVRIREGAWIQATSRLDQPGVGLVIGDDTYIGPRCLLGAGGGITIGAHVTFGAGVQLLAENHEFRDASRPIQEQGVTRAGIRVDDDVWVGNSVIVLDGVHIGRGAVIGAGAVVTRDVPAFAVAVGNPAKVVGERAASSRS